MTKKPIDLPILFFADPQSLANWFETHSCSSPGMRLQIAKKNSGVLSVTYEEALDIALCYGWIDSQKEKYDDKMWLQRFSPRGTKSIWSKVNKDKAEKMIAEGRMKPPGLHAIEAAKQNGLWDKAYESQSIASEPEDFAMELKNNEKAKAFYDTLDRKNKYAILFRIQNAKKQENRAKRIQQFIMMLENGEKFYP